MADSTLLGQHPAPRHTVVHLSDPHLLADGALQYGVVDTEAGLEAALERVRRLDPAPDALVLTGGDLADRAEPAAYARLRAILEPAARDLGTEIVYTMGNHDERSAMTLGLFGTADDRPVDRVVEVGGLRIVALDTSVPGYHHGELDDDQLAWLADVLATPATHGTLLAMHHPPIPVPMAPAAEIIELAEQERLAEVVRGTDVRAVLGGHFHFTSWSTFAGVPVGVASATCYTLDPAPDTRFVSGVDAHQAFTVLHLYADRVVHSVVPVAPSPEITGFPADVAAQVRALSPEERRELLARKDSAFYETPEGRSIG